MGLFKKIFKGDKPPVSEPPLSELYEDSDLDDSDDPKTLRREIVYLALGETMQRHGIPSDWINCRVLGAGGNGVTLGMYVHLIVRQGHEDLLAFVPAFQGSFKTALEKLDPRASDWMLSLAWEFDGMVASAHAPLEMYTPPVAAAAVPDVSADLAPQDMVDAPDTLDEDDVERDLRALFAIRDEALKPQPKGPPPDHVDFQPTRPGF